MSASQSVCESLESRRLYSFTTLSLPAAPDQVGDGSAAPHIAPGPGNSIWVTDPSHARIIRLGSDGKTRQFLLPKLAGPSAIVQGANGTMWFVDDHTHKVGRVFSSGNISEMALPSAPRKRYAPLALALGPDGNIWVTATHTELVPPGNDPPLGVNQQQIDLQIVARITPRGAVKEFKLPKTTGGNGLPVDIVSDQGSLFVPGDSQLIQVGVSGRLTFFPASGETDFVEFKIVRPDGYLGGAASTVTVQNGVAVANYNGQLDPAEPDGYLSPQNVAGGSDGNVWFTLSGPNSFGRVTNSGVFSTFATPGSDPVADITTGHDANLWMVSADLAHVYRLTLSNSILARAATLAYLNSGSVPNLLAGLSQSIVVATFEDTTPGSTVSDFTSTVTWSDGATTQGKIGESSDGTYSVTTDHAVSIGQDFATVTIQDTRSGETEVVKSEFNGTISQPTATGINIAATGGQSFSGNVGRMDAVDVMALGSYTTFISWGDGTTSLGMLVADGTSSALVTGSHTYGHAGQYTVTVNELTPTFPLGGGSGNYPYYYLASSTSSANVSAGSVEGFGFLAENDWPSDSSPTTQLLATFTSSQFTTADLSHYSATVSFRTISTSGGQITGTQLVSLPLSLALNHHGGVDASLALDSTVQTELDEHATEYAAALTDDRAGSTPIGVAHGVVTENTGLGIPPTPLEFDVSSLHLPSDLTVFVMPRFPFQYFLPLPAYLAVPAGVQLQVATGQATTLEVATISRVVRTTSVEPGATPDQINVDPAMLHGFIDWGDGTASAASFTVDAVTGLVHVAGSHAYSSPGSYTVRVSVTQDPPAQPGNPQTYPEVLLPLLVSTITAS